MWLSWLGVIPQSERSLVQFPVRAHAWVVGLVPSWSTYERRPPSCNHHTVVCVQPPKTLPPDSCQSDLCICDSISVLLVYFVHWIPCINEIYGIYLSLTAYFT